MEILPVDLAEASSTAPRRARYRRRRRWIALVALAGALTPAALGLVAPVDEADEVEVVGEPRTAPADRRYLPTGVPADLAVEVVRDTPPPVTPASVRYAYFGAADAPAPFAGRAAMVAVTAAVAPGDDEVGARTRAVLVHGAPAQLRPAAEDVDEPTVLTFTTGAQAVMVAARSLTDDELVAFAEALEIDAAGGVRAARPVAGLVPVDAAGTGPPGFSDEHWARYVVLGDVGGSFLSLSFAPAGPDRLVAMQWAGAVPTTLGDRPAVHVAAAGPDSNGIGLYAWLDDGVLLCLTGRFPDATLRALADAVREVPPAAWAAQVTAAPAGR